MGRGWLDANLGLLLQAYSVAEPVREEVVEEERWRGGDGALLLEVERKWVVARLGGGRALRFRRRVRLPPLLCAAAAVYQLAAGAVGRVTVPPRAAVRVRAAGREGVVETTVVELVRLWERKGWELIWRR